MVAMRPKLDKPVGEQAVGLLAAGQHGVVSLAQLEAAGLSARAVSRRVSKGVLYRIHRGVFAVGHPNLTAEGRWLAAVLACGPGAVLSHRSAAALWRLLPPPGGPIHVSVPSLAGRAKRTGIAIHRRSSLIAPARVAQRSPTGSAGVIGPPPGRSGCDTTTHRGIPVTTPACTLADLRRTLRGDQLQRALRAAEVLRLDTGRQPGFEPDRARSDLERRFLRLCRRHRLPHPQHNTRIGPYEVDFLWPDTGLIVELDGYRFHGTRTAFEADRARDVELKLMAMK